MKIVEFDSNQIRQAIDAEGVFRAWTQAKASLNAVKGSMFWREQSGKTYLIRSNTAGEQRSLGPQSDETIAIFDRFVAQKADAASREKSLRQQVEMHRRMNRALSLGRMPPVVIDILSELEQHGVGQDFLVVGTFALFAYAAAARIHLSPDDTATTDVDLLFDVRRHLKFARVMRGNDLSLLGIIRKADPSFQRRDDQLCTAVNDKGFEVDVVRRMTQDGDPHPLRMTEAEDDFYAAQINAGTILQDGARLDQLVIATNGEMAMMKTVSPAVFCRAKMFISKLSNRDQDKARRDIAQVDLVRSIVGEYLPQWGKGMPGSDANTGNESAAEDAAPTM